MAAKKADKPEVETTEVETIEAEETTPVETEAEAEPEAPAEVEAEAHAAEENESSGTLSVKIAVVPAPEEDPIEVDQELEELSKVAAATPEDVNYVRNDQGIQFRLGNSWTFCTTAQVQAYEVYGSKLAQQFIRVPVSELPESLQGVATVSAEAGFVWVLVQPVG